MILTVTLNTGVDRVLLVDELIPGQPTTGRKEVACVGGKGLDASVALRGLGLETVGLSFMAGENGRWLERMLLDYGIIPETVWVEGETRTNYVIAEARHKRVSHIKLGSLVVRPQQVEELVERFRQRLAGCEWAILAGSLPEGVRTGIYGELVEIARQAGVPALLDSRGAPVLEALASRPAILKVNRDEFNSTFGTRLQALEELPGPMEAVRAQHGLGALVVTCGGEGMVAAAPQGTYRVRVPAQEAVNAAGAGDAASAALCWRLGAGDDWPTALRWAGAVSAAAVRTEGTGEVRKEEAERIYSRVRVERVSR